MASDRPTDRPSESNRSEDSRPLTPPHIRSLQWVVFAFVVKFVGKHPLSTPLPAAALLPPIACPTRTATGHSAAKNGAVFLYCTVSIS